MKRIILAVMLPLLWLVGCYKPAESLARPGGGQFEVEKLFEHEGCTAYRFIDGGTARYYTRCSADVTTTWNETCGKNCTRSISIPTKETTQ